MKTYWDNEIDKQERQLEENYEKQLAIYNKHVENLKKEKEQFIKDNPDYPNPDALFLNVMAPPKQAIIKRVK